MIDYKNTAAQIADSDADIAVIPIGSVEQHSSHLPIGTDCMLAEAFANSVAERIGGILFPVIPISTCYEHKGIKGSLWMRPVTFYQMLQDIALCLKEQGINKIAFIPGHGGIFVAPPAIRELNATNDNLQALWVEPPLNSLSKGILESNSPDIHAGELETSLMLYLHEDLVKKDLMKENDFIPDYPQSLLNYAPLKALSPTGVWRRPSLASKEKGEQLFKICIDERVEYIKEAFKIGTYEKW